MPLLKDVLTRFKFSSTGTSGVKNDLNGINSSARAVGPGLKSARAQAENLIRSIKRLILASAGMYGITTAIQSTITAGADLEEMLDSVSAKARPTAREFALLEKQAEALGESTKYSATEAAGAMKYMAMAGQDASQIYAGLPSILNLAAVGETDLATAADIATNIMSGFGWQASETSRMVDILTKTANNANLNITELGYSMKYAAPNARTLGWDAEQTATALWALADAGVKGEMAGTQLRAMLQRLAAPTQEAQKALASIGLTVDDLRDSSGNLLPLSELVGVLDSKISKLGASDKIRILSDVLGMEAASAGTLLLNKGADALQKYTNTLYNSAGYAEAAARQMSDNLKGHTREMSSALESVGISAYKTFRTELDGAVQSATASVRGFGGWIRENKYEVSAWAMTISHRMGQVSDGVGMLYDVGRIVSSSLQIAFFGIGKFIDETDIRITEFRINAMKALDKFNPFGSIDTGATEARLEALKTSVTEYDRAIAHSSRDRANAQSDLYTASIKQMESTEAYEKQQAAYAAAALKARQEAIAATQTGADAEKRNAEEALKTAGKIVQSHLQTQQTVQSGTKQTSLTQKQAIEEIDSLYARYYLNERQRIELWYNDQKQKIKSNIKDETERDDALKKLDAVRLKKYEEVKKDEVEAHKKAEEEKKKLTEESIRITTEGYVYGFNQTLEAYARHAEDMIYMGRSMSEGLTRGFEESFVQSFQGKLHGIQGFASHVFGSIQQSFYQMAAKIAAKTVLMGFKNIWDGNPDTGKGFVETMMGFDIPFLNFAQGTIWGDGLYGIVAGLAGRRGDHLSNDTVNARITPGEAVLQQSVTDYFRPMVETMIWSGRTGRFGEGLSMIAEWVAPMLMGTLPGYANGHLPEASVLPTTSGLPSQGYDIDALQYNVETELYGFKGGGIFKPITNIVKNIVKSIERVVKNIVDTVSNVVSSVFQGIASTLSPVLKPFMEHEWLGWAVQAALALGSGGASSVLYPMITADLTSMGLTFAQGGDVGDAFAMAGMSGMIAGGGAALGNLISGMPQEQLYGWEAIRNYPEHMATTLSDKVTQIRDFLGEMENTGDILPPDFLDKEYSKYLDTGNPMQWEAYKESLYKNMTRPEFFDYTTMVGNGGAQDYASAWSKNLWGFNTYDVIGQSASMNTIETSVDYLTKGLNWIKDFGVSKIDSIYEYLAHPSQILQYIIDALPSIIPHIATTLTNVMANPLAAALAAQGITGGSMPFSGFDGFRAFAEGAVARKTIFAAGEVSPELILPLERYGEITGIDELRRENRELKQELKGVREELSEIKAMMYRMTEMSLYLERMFEEGIPVREINPDRGIKS